MTELVRGVGRPPKYGVARSSSERNAERRAVIMAVVDAAEIWARAYGGGRGVEWDEAQVRLSAAVQAWRLYRGKRLGVRKDSLDDRG